MKRYIKSNAVALNTLPAFVDDIINPIRRVVVDTCTSFENVAVYDVFSVDAELFEDGPVEFTNTIVLTFHIADFIYDKYPGLVDRYFDDVVFKYDLVVEKPFKVSNGVATARVSVTY